MQHAASAARSINWFTHLSHYWWTTRWHMVYSDRKPVAVEGLAPRDLKSFHRMPQPPRVLWADPFLVDFHGHLYLFYEECRYGFWGRSTGSRGRICVMKYQHGQWSQPAVVLERPYHLSYPFVFEWNMNFYMIPETMGNRTIELYRAVDFPFGWELYRTLMHEVKATDSTLFCSNSQWWMFCCREDDAPPNRDLYLYSTDDPVDGDWKPHPVNPVISDTRFARCAGRVFHDGENFIRPAQDCSTGYGGAVQFRRIVALTPSLYHEEPAGRLGPEGVDGAEGVHTWNAAAGLRVADVRERVARWRLC